MSQRGGTICSVIFLVRGNENYSEIYGRMTVEYGGSCMRQRRVYEWVEGFKGGHSSAADARSQRPPIVICVEVEGRSVSVFGTTEE
jgi:hypothetical protein